MIIKGKGDKTEQVMHNTNAHYLLTNARPHYITVICVSLGLPAHF